MKVAPVAEIAPPFCAKFWLNRNASRVPCMVRFTELIAPPFPTHLFPLKETSRFPSKTAEPVDFIAAPFSMLWRGGDNEKCSFEKPPNSSIPNPAFTAAPSAEVFKFLKVRTCLLPIKVRFPVVL